MCANISKKAFETDETIPYIIMCIKYNKGEISYDRRKSIK